MSRESFDQRAARLARATAELAPGPAFTAAVLLAVRGIEPGVWTVLPQLGRRAALGFGLLALVAVGCAAASAGSVERALAGNFNQVELEW